MNTKTYARVNHFMLLHMYESNEAETDKRGETVQMRGLKGRFKKREEKNQQNGTKTKQSDRHASSATNSSLTNSLGVTLIR